MDEELNPKKTDIEEATAAGYDEVDEEGFDEDETIAEFINRTIEQNPAKFRSIRKEIRITKEQGCPWSQWLEDNYSCLAAWSFATGAYILMDEMKEDIRLMEEEAVTDAEALETVDFLPPAYMKYYDVNFMKKLYALLVHLRERAVNGKEMMAHSIAEELLFRACALEAITYAEISLPTRFFGEMKNLGFYSDWYEEWIYNMFDDEDVETFFFSGEVSDYLLGKISPSDLDHWFDHIFYMHSCDPTIYA